LAIKYLDAKRIRALSSDTLPTNVPTNTIAEITDIYSYRWYNGTNWVPNPALYEASAITSGGNPASRRAKTYTYENQVWATGADTNVAAANAGGGGNLSNAIIFGGYTGGPETFFNRTETWSGGASGTWTNQTGTNQTLSQTRSIFPSGGNASDAWAAGGWSSGQQNSTEEWNGSTWSAGGSWGSASTRASYGTGNQTGAITAGGNGTSAGESTNQIQSYNGSSWTDEGDLTYNMLDGGIAGTQSSMISIGGQASGSENSSYNFITTNIFDGTSATTSVNLPVGLHANPSGGTSSNCITIGGLKGTGSTGSITTDTEWFNGTTWRATGNTPSAISTAMAGSN